ncbi:MAG: carbohydrate ABC transporter permease [Clostridiales bacterium]|jgi:ABC-type glycerol-3-phosphate transport system permease component|nr:carbohydrate ABC transporter permease [Clostridiales bacterium]
MLQVDIEYLKGAKRRKSYGVVWIMIILAILGIFMVLPLVYLVSTAFKPPEELFLYPPRFFVSHPTMKNMTDLINATSSSLVPFTRYLFNSILVSAVTVSLLVIISSMACYPLAKHKFPAKAFIFNLITISLMFAPEVVDIPRFLVIANLHIMNTYWALILPGLAFPTGLFLMKQFLEQVPDDIFEAAKIDGASEMQMFKNIALPLIRNAQATVVILSFTGIWNDASTSTTYIQTDQLKSLAFYMSTITGAGAAAAGVARQGAAAAATFIMTIPTVLMFILQQSRVMETMAHSGIK